MKTNNSNSKRIIPGSSINEQLAPVGIGQNRRDTLLKGLALLPIPAALAACGGGGDGVDAQTSASNPSAPGSSASSKQSGADTLQAVSNPLPSALVPQNNQFQVEVVFCTKNIVKVYLKETVNTEILIASKPYTQDNSHAVGFSLFRCDETAVGSPKAGSFRLIVDAYDGNGNLLTNIVMPGVASSTYAEYKEHNDGGREYEWAFYNVVDGIANRLCYVRFFPLAADDREAFDHQENVKVIENTARHQNAWARTLLSPQLHATSMSIPTHEAGVFNDYLLDANTIALPNRRHGPDHRELMPCYLEVAQGTDERFKRALGRRLSIHMARFKVKMAGIDPIDTRTDKDPFNALGNEVFTIMGGSSLIDGLSKLRTHLVEQSEIDTNYTGVGKLFDVLRDSIAPLSTTASETGTRNLRDACKARQLETEDDWDFNALGGLGVTTALQIGGSYTDYLRATETEGEFMGCFTGIGFRVSLALSKYSVAANYLGSLKTNYNISNPPDGEYKLGIVGIIKSWSTEEIRLKGVSYDVELTFSLTVKKGARPRIDNITLDPVIDYDTSKLITKLLQWWYPSTKIVTESHLAKAIKFEIPTYLINSGAAVATATQELYAATAAFGLSAVNIAIARMGNIGLSWRNFTVNEYKTAEVSPLRLAITNIKANDPTIPFTPKLLPVAFGWVPGLKYIAGTGVTYESTFFAGASEQTLKAFIRHVSIAESYVAIGSENFVKGYGYPISSAGGG